MPETAVLQNAANTKLQHFKIVPSWDNYRKHRLEITFAGFADKLNGLFCFQFVGLFIAAKFGYWLMVIGYWLLVIALCFHDFG
jgi:hypothetical protein